MKVIYTLATAGFSDLVGLKVGTSLAKAGNTLQQGDDIIARYL